jgi:hypothetical protein
MAVRNFAKQHPTAKVPQRMPFIGDPAALPQPRKLDNGNFAPLPSSRYLKPTYKRPGKK